MAFFLGGGGFGGGGVLYAFEVCFMQCINVK